MATLSKKEAEQEQQQQQAKNGYWQNELNSLGIEPKQKNELNDNKEELENLADIIKQAMYHDYKVAYSEEGDAHKEEARSTVTYYKELSSRYYY
jgi:DNA repair ATPase RecN